jgi:hypothetical protein
MGYCSRGGPRRAKCATAVERAELQITTGRPVSAVQIRGDDAAADQLDPRQRIAVGQDGLAHEHPIDAQAGIRPPSGRGE